MRLKKKNENATLADEIAELAASLIETARETKSSSVLLLTPCDDGKGSKACGVVINPGCIAPRGELLWIDDRFHDAASSERLHFRDDLVGRLQPLLVGGDQCRIIGNSGADRLVIFGPEPRDYVEHGSIPTMDSTAVLFTRQLFDS